MIFEKDFTDLIELLNLKQTKYVLVGGLAVVVHGLFRTTKDMDIFYERTEENCLKLLDVIDDFGFERLRFTVADLMDENCYIQLGHDPVRIDFFNDLPGVEFENVYNNAIWYEEEDVRIKVIHVNHLIQNKNAVGRLQDLDDVKKLKKLLAKKVNKNK